MRQREAKLAWLSARIWCWLQDDLRHLRRLKNERLRHVWVLPCQRPGRRVETGERAREDILSMKAELPMQGLA